MTETKPVAEPAAPAARHARGVLGFTRKHEGEELVCIFNMRGAAVVVPLPDDIAPGSIETPLPALVPAGGSWSLPPFGAYIGGL
jgi:hypothetical protein